MGEETRVDVALDRDAEACAARWRETPGVTKVTETGDGRLSLLTADASALMPRLFEDARAAGAHITEINLAEPNLETVFLHLTGRALRD